MRAVIFHSSGRLLCEITRKMIFLSLLFLLVTGCHAAEEGAGHLVSDIFTRMTSGLSQIFDPESELMYNRMVKRQKAQPLIPDEIQFPCDTTRGRSQVRPTDVDHVAPGDIDVVAAIGDSLTTASGARAPNVFFVTQEDRGISWSIGGQDSWRKFLTLPNILRLFNPNLIGFSASSDDIQFNGGVSNAGSIDLPWLTRTIVDRIVNDSRVDVESDWKLVTIMIGHNDFCKRICLSGQQYEDMYEKLRNHLTEALDYIRDSLPRTIVNLVLPPVLDIFRRFDTGFCHMVFTLQCPCLSGATREKTEEEISEMQTIWLKVQEEVAADERYRKEDFTVVVQPFMKNVSAIDDFFSKSLFADDCIHFSQKGQATIANAVWNNMLQPVGQKADSWMPLFDSIICPTEEHPYIFTYSNSPNMVVVLQESQLNVTSMVKNST